MKNTSFAVLSLAILLVASPVFAEPTAQPSEFGVGGFSFVRPAVWDWVQPSSPMRKAELRVPSADGAAEPAEILFFHFGPGQGGGVDANVSRWLGQFVEPLEQLGAQRAEETFGGTKVTLLQAKGTYLAGMPGQALTPKKNYALRGAILSSPGGDVYVKMTGPESVVENAAATFDAMVIEAAKAAPAR